MISKGDTVVLEYEGKLENGEIFDSSERAGKPLEFVAGEGKVIKGFDNFVLGMKKGEEKEFSIKPEDSYGPIREELKKEVPKKAINVDKELKEGMTLIMATTEGQQIPLRIEEVKKETIVLDMNHPLAGKILKFKIKIVDVKK